MERLAVRSEPSLATWVTAVAAPLAAAAAAHVLWWLGDRDGYIGPFDRAAFGWAVVVPVWLASPVLAGWAWRGLSGRQAAGAAVGVLLVVSVAVAGLFWAAVAFRPCEAAHMPEEWVVPSIVAGALVGGGSAVSGAAARAAFRAGRRATGVAIGIASEAFFSLLAVLVIGVAFLAGPGCQRPA